MATSDVLWCCVYILMFSSLTSAQIDQSCVAANPPADTTTIVLLDTNHYTNLPWSTFVNVILHNGSICMPVVEICTEREYGFATNVIQKPASATLLSISVQYDGNCSSSSQGCLTPGFIASNSDPGQPESDSSLYTALQPIQNGLSMTFNASGEFIHFSFFGSSSCLNITRLTVSYSTCPLANFSQAVYPEGNSGSLVTGTCVANAVQIGPALSASCDIGGRYTFLSPGCQCQPGYTGDKCEPCEAGMFKMSAGNEACMVCPDNSNSITVAATSCPTCKNGYQRPSGMTEGACSECMENYFLSSGTCTPCPTNSLSSGGTASQCICEMNRVTAINNSITTSAVCSLCALNTYLVGQSCDSCPNNSVRSFDMGPDRCHCLGNTSTASGDITTTSLSCNGCRTNFFLFGATCMACPSNSVSSGNADTQCTCETNLVTSANSSTTTSEACDSCAMNTYFNGLLCDNCPGNSTRHFQKDESHCVCLNNTVTTDGDATTTFLPCIGCKNNFFLRQSICTNCPTNSVSSDLFDTTCTCRPGTTIAASGTTTTSNEACSGCAAGYFRTNSGVCNMCPNNSARLSPTERDTICDCETNYGRHLDDADTDCAPFVGFTSQTMELFEGQNMILVQLSAVSYLSISVPIRSPVETSQLMFSTNSQSAALQVDINDNEVALESQETFTISIEGSTLGVAREFKGSSFTLYPSIMVTTRDTDMVTVGFAVDSVRYNESSRNLKLKITRLQATANNFYLNILTDTEDLLKIPANVTIPAGMDTNQVIEVSFQIVDNTVGGMPDQTVELTLEFNSPSEFMNLVVIGGSGTNSKMTVVVIDDDAPPSPTPFPTTAIIGIAVGSAGAAVLLLVIVILCFCIFRLQANRQGFYPTYENKTTEAPTMIRYSASLRSISSQTVTGISEGKPVPRENEFYV